MTMAVLLSKAWMGRKWRGSGWGGMAQGCQTKPASSVRRTVPLVPEAQATPPPTLSIPRRSAVVWASWSCHWAWRGAARRTLAKTRAGRIGVQCRGYAVGLAVAEAKQVPRLGNDNNEARATAADTTAAA